MHNHFSAQKVLQDLYVVARTDKTVAQKCAIVMGRYGSHFENRKDREDIFIEFEKKVASVFEMGHLPLVLYVSVHDCDNDFIEGSFPIYREGKCSQEFVIAILDILYMLDVSPEIKISNGRKTGKRLLINEILRREYEKEMVSLYRANMNTYFDDINAVHRKIEGNCFVLGQKMEVYIPIEEIYPFDTGQVSNYNLRYTIFDLYIGIPVT